MSLQRALQQFTNQQPQRDTRPPSSLLHTRFTRNSRAHERAHCTPRAPLPGLAWLWPGTEVQLGTADGASSLIHLSILSHTHTHQLRVLACVACLPVVRRLLRAQLHWRPSQASDSAISATCAPARPSPQRSEFVGGPACRSTAGANGRACCQSLLLAPKCKDFHLSPTARLVFPVSCHRSTNESPREISRTSSTPLERHRRSIVTGVSTSTSALQRHR